ncbi:MAG: hypothetical protein HYS98_06670 [Deltaproteobacteria bacterium]|nr:hypothetical protein [Deltaproteobacteria bacterium]
MPKQKTAEEKTFEECEKISNLFRSMEKSFADFAGVRRPGALDQAQDLIYDAWEQPSSQERIRLAKKALKLSKDCADAYCILADEQAKTLEETHEYLKQGVEAGERAIGKKGFIKFKGHFWGFIETRPYMRARFDLARCLWALDRREEALDRFYALLKLNPGDNQGVRYNLLNFLFILNDLNGVKKLLNQYRGDCSAEWAYSQLLYTFVTDSKKDEELDKCYEKALKINKYVVDYILGKKRISTRLPSSYTMGSNEEAVSYAVEGKAVWLKYPQAIKWLQSKVI